MNGMDCRRINMDKKIYRINLDIGVGLNDDVTDKYKKKWKNILRKEI